ncbi:MAG TPA: 3-mercaptopyruvate sulfurtransferase [Gemmatimonadales bacterium]|nr:3-mercaptopyruvate sulfurtransferase [Gemmatimonadales bacterium]
MTPSVVSTHWLAERLDRLEVRVLDASWYLPSSGRNGRAEFVAGHIPGARYFDLDAASDHRTPLPHMLPTAARFAEEAGGLGVSNDSTVVIYDGSGANLSAGRAWWMFRVFGHDRVAVLDGGIRKWRAEGRALEPGMPRVEPAVFTAKPRPGIVRTMDEVADALRSGAVQVVDMRSQSRFEGSDPEPRPGLPSGHMPGALNLPYTTLVGADGTLLPPDELRQRIAAAGLRLDRPIIASCGSGVSACALLLALDTLGVQGTALYDGSWTEWVTARGAIETG